MAALRFATLLALALALAVGCSSNKGRAADSPTAPDSPSVPGAVAQWDQDPLGPLDRPSGDRLTGVIEEGKTLVLSLDGVRLIAMSSVLPVGARITLVPATDLPDGVELYRTPFTVTIDSETALPEPTIFFLEATLADLPQDTPQFTGWKAGAPGETFLKKMHPDLTFIGGSEANDSLLRMMVLHLPGQACAVTDAEPLIAPLREATSYGGALGLYPARIDDEPPASKRFHVIIAHGTDGADAVQILPFWQTASFSSYANEEDQDPYFDMASAPLFAQFTPDQRRDTQVWWWFYDTMQTPIFPPSGPGTVAGYNAENFALAIKSQILDQNPDAQLLFTGHSQGGLQCLAAYDYLTNPANFPNSLPFEECILAGFVPLDAPLRGIEFVSILSAIRPILDLTIPPVQDSGNFDPLAIALQVQSLPLGQFYMMATGLIHLFPGITDMASMYKLDIRLGGATYHIGGNDPMEEMWGRIEGLSAFDDKFEPAAGFQCQGWTYLDGDCLVFPPAWEATRPANNWINAVYKSDESLLVSYAGQEIAERVDPPIYSWGVCPDNQRTDSLIMYWSQLGINLDNPYALPMEGLHGREHGCVATHPATPTIAPGGLTVGGWMSQQLSAFIAAAVPCEDHLLTNGRSDVVVYTDPVTGRDVVTVAVIGTQDNQRLWPYLIQWDGEGDWSEPQRLPDLFWPYRYEGTYDVTLLKHGNRWLIAATSNTTNFAFGAWITEDLTVPVTILPHNATDGYNDHPTPCLNGMSPAGPCGPICQEIDSAVINGLPALAFAYTAINFPIRRNAVEVAMNTDWPDHEWVYVSYGDDAPIDPFQSANSVSITPWDQDGVPGNNDGALVTTYQYWQLDHWEYEVNVYKELPTTLTDITHNMADPYRRIETPMLCAAEIREVNGELWVVYASDNQSDLSQPMTPSFVQVATSPGFVGSDNVLAGADPGTVFSPLQAHIGFEVLDGVPYFGLGSIDVVESQLVPKLWLVRGDPADEDEWDFFEVDATSELPSQISIGLRHHTEGNEIGLVTRLDGEFQYFPYPEP